MKNTTGITFISTKAAQVCFSSTATKPSSSRREQSVEVHT